MFDKHLPGVGTAGSQDLRPVDFSLQRQPVSEVCVISSSRILNLFKAIFIIPLDG